MKKLVLLLLIIFIGQISLAEEMTKSQQAVVLYNDNNIKGAMELLKSIPETDKTAQDWLLLGNLLQDNNKISDAIFMYKRSILVDKSFYKPYFNLGNIYLSQERPQMAIDNYKTVIKLNAEFAYGYYNLGCAYLRLGNFKSAKKAFSKAVELKNTVPEFQYNLAYTYKQLNKNKLAQQHIEFYNKLIENK